MINQNVYVSVTCVYLYVFFFLPSGRLFDIVTPQVGPVMFHYLIQKVKFTHVNKILGGKLTLEPNQNRRGLIA